jgi:3-hydroxyisobutyrate dehydrogenase-like beta-hydroxyacid dehydrogenase
MSTVHPDTTRKQAKAYAEKGADFVSAPVFGSKGEAANGGLWIVVGGPEATVDRLRPALEAMSASVHHMGAAVEAGTSMKLVGNALVASMIEGLGEALLLAKKAGLDLDQVRDVIGETDFRSPLFDGVGAAMTERRFEPSFALRHMLKDANLINRLAKDLNTPAPVASAARETLKAAVNQGWGDEDAAALVKALEQDAGVTLDGTTQ